MKINATKKENENVIGAGEINKMWHQRRNGIGETHGGNMAAKALRKRKASSKSAAHGGRKRSESMWRNGGVKRNGEMAVSMSKRSISACQYGVMKIEVEIIINNNNENK